MAARGAALDILRAVRTGDSFDTALAGPLDRLSPADRRLAHEIASGVLRRRRDLDRRIRPLVSVRWNRLAPDVRDLLRLGAYQLTGLSRVPPYAAVQSTVEVAKGLGRPKSARLINAVLRELTRVGSAEVSDAVTAPTLALRYSHPEWLVVRWLERHGLEATKALLEHNNRRPPLVLQAARWSLTELRAKLEAAGIDAHVAHDGAGLLVPRGRRVRELPGYDEGGFVVQDTAQALVLRYAAIPNGELVWDACAAPGGKAAVLSRRGPVLASDRSHKRFGRLRETLARASSRETRLFVADAREAPVRPGALGAVVLDAPCSATGVLARHPDARWRLTPRRLASLVELQRALLEGVAAAVAPGGQLVYTTCSIEPEENALQIDSFLERHPGFERIGSDLSVFPPTSGSDGAFASRLRRAS